MPAPGGPSMSTWCPPAAATSIANRAVAWPSTSRRSGSPDVTGVASGSAPAAPRAVGAVVVVVVGVDEGLLRQRFGPGERDQLAQRPDAGDAQAGHEPSLGGVRGRDDHALDARRRRPQPPPAGPPAPAAPGRPAPARRAERPGRTRPPGRPTAAASTAAAIARSKLDPRLGRLAGERLMVIRRVAGQGWPLLTTAARTRSRDSDSDVSGSPTNEKDGTPCPRSASTSTR